MSNTPTPQLTEEQLRAAVEAAQKPSPAATEVEVKLATGQVYRGKTQEEVIQQLVHAQEEASKTIKAKSDENKRLSELAQQAQTPPKPAEPANGGFNNTEYWRLMEADPLAALNYELKHVFGMDVQELKSAIQEGHETTEQLRQHSAVALFMHRHPEWPSTEESSQLLLERLQERQLPLTTDSLELSFYSLVNEGKLKAEKPQEQSSAVNLPPPTLSGTGAGAPEPSIIEQAERMDSKQLEDLVTRLGMKR